MDKYTYSIESKVAEKLLRFAGRRKLLTQIICELQIPHEASILDIGTSSGTILCLLGNLGYKNILCLDNNNEALDLCIKKGLGPV